jgi:hypothetical protein
LQRNDEVDRGMKSKNSEVGSGRVIPIKQVSLSLGPEMYNASSKMFLIFVCVVFTMSKKFSMMN